ncbi:unnamed protein product [Rotaria sp. Silwood2]|nr:unnamed protein product [Rotaria sp. Silwood2]
MTEPHRFTSIMNCLTRITRQIVQQTSCYSQGQIYVLPLLMSVLPGIDLNDFDKTSITLDFFDTIFMLITCADCSSAVQTRNDLSDVIQEKITQCFTGAFLSPKVRKIVASLVQAMVTGNPIETIKYLLPQTCQFIKKIINNMERTVLLTDCKGDIELTWFLILFSELVRARGDVLLNYKSMIISIFHQCIHIIHKDSYQAIAQAATNVLQSLSNVYPIDDRSTIDNKNVLSVRTWGQSVDFDRLQIQYHIPNADEIDFACEFIETFIYPELTSLNENILTMSNDERLRSLTIILYIAIGCLRMVPRIDSKHVSDLMLSVVSISSNTQFQCSIYSKEPKFRENLRMRLYIDIGHLLDVMMENHLDDVSSMKIALQIYSLSSRYNGASEQRVNLLYRDITLKSKLFKNNLYGKRQYPGFLIIKKLELQIEVRRIAQMELFAILNRYYFGFEVIVDRLVALLNSFDEVNHNQIKGCFHILHGNYSFFFPTKYSWKMMNNLWPAIVSAKHVTKNSTQKLINDVSKRISKTFSTKDIIQNTNETAKHAAATLWRRLNSSEMKTCEESNRTNIQLYNHLMETLNSLLIGDTLNWGQQKMTMSFLCLLLQKYVPIPSSCIRTFVQFLVHDNSELRQGIVAFCRLQKPPRIFVEKPLNEILHRNGQIPLPIINGECYPGDRDDNLWVTINDYQPPETQIEWEQECFLGKSYHGYYTWPKRIKYSMNKRARYTRNEMSEQVAIIYDYFIDKTFLTRSIQVIIFDDNSERINFDRTQFAMFKGLFRNFGLAFIDNFMEQLYILVREKTKEKQEGSHRIAAEIVAGMIRGSKYWTLGMLDELWKKLTPLLTEVCLNLSSETSDYWSSCFRHSMENGDPRRMYRLIEFIRTLMHNQTKTNTLTETSRWCLIQQLHIFQWRIPSIWNAISEHAKDLLDHNFKNVRDRVANVLSISLSFDMTLFNGKSTRQLNVDHFIDAIRERLQRAIEIYEKAPLMNISDKVIEIDIEARKALNFIETGRIIISFCFFTNNDQI